MNIKQKIINDIIKIIYDNTVLDLDDGTKSYNIEDLSSKNRTEVVIYARCLLIQEFILLGFSIETIARILHKTKPAIRHLVKLGNVYEKYNKLYYNNKMEIIRKCKDYIESNKEESII